MNHPDLFDICASRHGGNSCSVEANTVVAKECDRARILAHLDISGGHGMTLDEMSDLMGRSANQLSGRFTELHAKGLIFRRGDKRPTRSGVNASVWRTK